MCAFTSRLTATLVVLISVLIGGGPASAACVGSNGQSRSGIKEPYSIGPGKTDDDRFVRMTKGPATVQVDVRGSRDSRGQGCSSANEKLSFSLHWKQNGAASDCLSPRVRGPASFLSCFYNIQMTLPGGGAGKWYVRVKNPGRCTVNYHLICRDGKHTP